MFKEIIGSLPPGYTPASIFHLLTLFPELMEALRLENFAYRISIGPGIFLIAAAISLSIALITVTFHTAKAALTNPVETIRYE